MPEPEKVLTIREVEVGGVRVPADTVIWKHGQLNSAILVEYKNHFGQIAVDATTPYPVPQKSTNMLQELDSCFGLGDEAFEIEFSSSRHYYQIMRCRAHSRRFLRDTRGGAFMHERLTLLRSEDNELSPDDIWRKYHQKSDSWLMMEGRTQ